MDYMKYVKCYGGYILAVGAGCCLATNLYIGLALLAAAGYMAYNNSCCKV